MMMQAFMIKLYGTSLLPMATVRMGEMSRGNKQITEVVKTKVNSKTIINSNLTMNKLLLKHKKQ